MLKRIMVNDWRKKMYEMNIVIPVLNEENALENGVQKTIDFLNTTRIKDNFIITIADNGSTDKTGDIAQRLCSIYKNVHYFKVSKKGVGLAFREAIKSNSSDIVGYMDVDLATDIRHLCDVYNYFKDNETDIVVGSRLLKGSKVYGRTMIREITSRGLNIILKILLGVKFSDAMCGFKFYRADIANKMVSVCSDNDGWFYCAEMMIRAEWENISIKEIPVEWHDDSSSKVKIGKLSASYMSEIIKLCKIKRKNRR
jgi:glycosyltransferase involved in cell wall biosynthesis